jgi:hypothetical protein
MAKKKVKSDRKPWSKEDVKTLKQIFKNRTTRQVAEELGQSVQGKATKLGLKKIGLVEVEQPRVNDKRIDEDGQPKRFSSKILPPYLRRTKSIDELIPWLYLRGISTGDFSEALQALLGMIRKDAWKVLMVLAEE